MLYQILICRLTLSVPCKKCLWLSHHQAKYNGVLPATSIFRWILHYHNLLTYLNDHRKNSSNNYIIFISFIYFNIIFNLFSENDIIYMHTILLTKYEMGIQRRSNIYIWIPPKLIKIWHVLIFKHDIALLYWCRWYYTPRVNDPKSDINPSIITLNNLPILIQTPI